MNDENKIKEACKNLGYDINFVDENAKFNFGCSRCGSCCRGFREDIMLNPYDVYRLCQATGLSGEDFIMKYCTNWIGENSRVPIFALSHNKKNGRCHFLDFDVKTGLFGCTVNDHKPGSCMNHPIGIVREFEKDNPRPLKFFLTEMCKNHNETEQTVGEWVKPYVINIEEHNVGSKLALYPREYFDSMLLCDIIEKKGKYNEITDEKILNQISSNKLASSLYIAFVGMVVKSLYSFDPQRPFLEQVDERKEVLHDGIDTFIDIFSKINIDLRKKEED